MLNRKDIIRMAREAGCDPHDMSSDFTVNLTDLERFAALVAAHEREVCAKMCEESNTWDLYDPNGFAANLIRAREEK